MEEIEARRGTGTEGTVEHRGSGVRAMAHRGSAALVGIAREETARGRLEEIGRDDLRGGARRLTLRTEEDHRSCMMRARRTSGRGQIGAVETGTALGVDDEEVRAIRAATCFARGLELAPLTPSPLYPIAACIHHFLPSPSSFSTSASCEGSQARVEGRLRWHAKLQCRPDRALCDPS